MSVILAIKASPNAKKSEILYWELDPVAGKVLRVRVAAPPTEGKANKTLIQFLSLSLGISKSKITLLKGETSRIKRVEIHDEEKRVIATLEKKLTKTSL